MKQQTFSLPLAIVAVLGLAICAGLAYAGLGSVLYEDPSTMRSIPKKTAAGFLATADGGVVNVMNSPAPTAVGQALQITSLSPPAAQWTSAPDGGILGAGTASYIPVWNSANHLTNSQLQETVSGNLLSHRHAGTQALSLESYVLSGNPIIYLRHSYSGTVSAYVTTVDGSSLGILEFDGVNAYGGGPFFYYGAGVQATQVGSAGSIFVPAKLVLWTSSASAQNSTQLVLNPDNSVSMSGPVSAANLPYCKKGEVLAGGTSWGTDTATGTLTSRTCQAIPVSSTSIPSLVQISTATPLMDAASGNAGNGLQCSAWNHIHPNSQSGLIYYATSGAGFSTTLPVTTTELTQAMAAGSATVNLATSSGTPGLGVWPAGTLNFDVWAYMSSMGSGCTYTLEATNPPTVVAAVRGTSTPYQTGASTAGVTLTGSYARYQFTIPVSQLTGTATDIFKTPIVVTSANTTTCNAATLHVGVGTGQATNIGTLFYQVPSLDGVEYQANKGAANGYCPLDAGALVPVTNLPAGTESVAGTMSAADKTKLDGISAGATVDAFTVKAAAGTTPGYLGAVCESTDSSITIGQTGDYVTFAANFGTGAAQVCSGATCAGLQSQLPACAPGQIEIFGTVTQTGTATGTVTSRTCQNSPYQPVGSYQPALPPGTNNQVLAYSVTGTGTGTNIVAKTPSVNAGNGISVSGTNPVTGLTISANIASSRNISTATASTTAVSTATTMYGSDSQVVLPVANATTQGISKVASNAAIASSTNTGTASSTAGATCMPADATANGDHRVSVASGSTPYYLGDAVIAAASPAVGGAPIALSIDDEGGGVKYLMLGARAGSSSVSGMVRLDPNAPPALDGGPATTGSRGLAADSGNKPKLGGNSPTPRQALIGGTCSNTATGTNTTTAINFCPLQVTDVNGAVGGSGSTSHYSKWTAGSQLGNAFITEDAAQPQINGSFSAGTTSIDYAGPAQYSAMELPRGELLFSNTNASNQAYLFSNAYEKSDGTQAYRYTGPAAGLGMQDGIIYALTAPSGTQNAAISWVTQATISSTGIAGSNITATPTANAIPKADGSGTLNAWVTNHASIFHDTSLATTVAIGDYPTWHTILTFNTGGTAGAIVVHATVTVKCNGGGSSAIAYVRLAMGAAQLDGQYLATVPAAAYGYYGYATLSANSYAPFSAGAHTVGLQAYTDTTSCVVQGNDQITGGSAVLVATEYTN